MPRDHVEVRAAGGVVCKYRKVDGQPLIVLVHRSYYDDWTLPKGKLESDESFEDAALREVFEETNLVCSLSQYIGETKYQVEGVDKIVRYWILQVLRNLHFSATPELSDLKWLKPLEAVQICTYQSDRDIITTALPYLVHTG